MEFRIDDGILTKYASVRIGVLTGRGLDIGEHDFKSLQEEVIESARKEIGTDPITQHAYIRSWREIYRSFGTKPGDYRPSAEALTRRVLRGRGFPVINAVVNAYNALSVKHLIPMGGFDLDKVEGAITLRFSEGGEIFTPLGSKGTEETYQGEVVYADESRILTRRWNFRDCEETKITTETENLVMFADGSPDMPREHVEEALNELSAVLQMYCGGRMKVGVACAGTPVIQL